MEEVFSLPRFGYLLKTDLLKAWRNMNFSFFLMSGSAFITYLLILFARWMSDADDIFLLAETRALIFGVMVATLTIITPSRCFGSVTDLKAGRFYLSLPASVLEKTLSMLLVCAIIIPLLACAVYFSLDELVCWMDPTCGSPLLSTMGKELLGMMEYAPFSLAFLLGAIYFKKSKIPKTIGCILLFYVFFYPLLSPIFDATMQDFQFLMREDLEQMAVGGLFSGAISLVLTALIYWRVRTLQH